tara:strand:- start:13046 stop:13228 length:183 start_codon:yes stop_codon:yes gene_type:complete
MEKVTNKTGVEFAIGDKVTNRFGGQGVVTSILPKGYKVRIFYTMANGSNQVDEPDRLKKA